MFNQALSMNNSKDIVANSIKLVNENEMRDINDIFYLNQSIITQKYILMISLVIIIQKYKQTSFSI